MKIITSFVALVLFFTLAIAAFCFSTASPIPHSTTFPSRFHNTLPHRRAVQAEAEYARLLGHTPNSTANWLNQPIYHRANDPSQPTFRQKWYYDTSFWPGPSAVANATFAQLYINGEGPISSSPSGYMANIAQQTNSLLVTMEHRWYGESLPGNRTDTQLLLNSLDLELVLEDLGNFMTYVEQTLNGGVPMKWYCSGGSYSGALSSWLKAKYPNRLMMAWSSSGVVHPIFDFTEFDGHIKKVIPDACGEALRLAFVQMSNMYDDSKTQLLYILGGVAPYFTKGDIAWMLADGSAMQVQYGGKDNLCNTLLNRQVNPGLNKPYYSINNDALYRLVTSINTFWGPTWLNTTDNNCYYSTECLSNPEYQSSWGPAGYSWVTQCCTQFSWWQVGYHNSLRLKEVLNTTYYQEQCRSMFKNPTMFPEVYTFNAIHGGLQPSSTNVIATQGSDDPWQTAGVRQDYPEQNYFWKLAQCHGCGHCGDLGTPSEFDPQSLTEQRQWIANYVHKWLNTGMMGQSNSNHEVIKPKKLMGSLDDNNKIQGFF